MGEWSEPMATPSAFDYTQNTAEEAMRSLDLDPEQFMQFAKERYRTFQELVLQGEDAQLDDSNWVTLYVTGFMEGIQLERNRTVQ